MDSSILWLLQAVLAQGIEVNMYRLSNTHAHTDGCSADYKKHNSQPASHYNMLFSSKEKKNLPPIVSRYIILCKYVGCGNVLNAEEKEKENHLTRTKCHCALSTGQGTKKPPLAQEEGVNRGILKLYNKSKTTANPDSIKTASGFWFGFF